MARIFVRYSDGSEAEIDSDGDESERVLIGSSDQCQIRLQGEGILPVHAYLAGRSYHYGLLLAPGAKVNWNGLEVGNEDSLTDNPDLARFRWTLWDRFTVELAGAIITVHHIGG
jgi:hypothetical protein